MTDNPVKLFSIMGKNIGTTDSSTGNWSPDPKVEKEVEEFIFNINATKKVALKADFDQWIANNAEYIKRSLGPNSKTRTCTIYLQIDQSISEQDVTSLKSILGRYHNPPFITAYLNSRGGEVDAAVKLGRLFRQHYATVNVAKHHNFNGSAGVGCFSACVLIYASGIAKYIGLNENGNGQWYDIGIHQSFLSEENVKNMSVEDGIATLKRTNKSIANYFDEMGVSKELLNLSNSVGKNRIKLLNEKELKTYLPFVVSEYAAILPIKITQSTTSVANLVFRSMDLAIKALGPEKTLLEYLKVVDDIVMANFELFKWAGGPAYPIEVGVYYQNL
ncbi:hypothetical protein N8146_09915 [Ascidiaceihabitans sp.]|nr:hypothetical protein [Ascidiaceihabitans sp.]